MILIIHPMPALQNQRETSSALTQCTTAMYLDSSIIPAIPIWQYTLLFGTGIIEFTILRCLRLDRLNRTKSYVLITKLKRELKFDKNVYVARKTVEGGYSEIKKWNLFLI